MNVQKSVASGARQSRNGKLDLPARGRQDEAGEGGRHHHPHHHHNHRDHPIMRLEEEVTKIMTMTMDHQDNGDDQVTDLRVSYEMVGIITIIIITIIIIIIIMIR